MTEGSATPLEVILRRDRSVILAAMATLVALCWAYLIWLAQEMSMPVGMSALAPELREWHANDVIVMLGMWAVMMVGMMTPSAAPMILLHARVGRHATEHGGRLAATGFFAGGYLLAWTLFSLVATAGQWALEQFLLLTPTLNSANTVFSGLVLIIAGLYQWTPMKQACLRRCQAPLQFIQQHGGFRRDAGGSLRLGFLHGLYCVGCCWALMGLLFVGGVMNLLWIAALSIVVFAEKLVPTGHWLPRLSGTGLGAVGLWSIATAIG